MSYKNIIFSAFIVLAAFFTACTNSTREHEGGEIIVRVGSSVLTNSELRRQIPVGVSSVDSVRLARSFVRSWIDSKLISEVASKNIGNLDEIDRLTDDYRNELIAYHYRRQLINAHESDSFSEDSLMAYYNANKSSFVVQRPLVKGVYVKVPDNSPSLSELKRLYKSDKPNDIDLLEKKTFDGVVHYDYFRDRWVDWEQIEAHIPYDFGSTPQRFLSGSRKLDFSEGGFTYLLYITDIVPAGSIAPFEYARDEIIREKEFISRADMDRRLRVELLKNANENGQIEIFCDLDS